VRRLVAAALAVLLLVWLASLALADLRTPEPADVEPGRGVHTIAPPPA